MANSSDVLAIKPDDPRRSLAEALLSRICLKVEKPSPQQLVKRPYQHQQNVQVTDTPVPSKAAMVPRDSGLLDVKQASSQLGMSAKWLYRNYKDLPHVLIPAGKKPRIKFRRSDLEAWIESHKIDWRRGTR